MDRLEILKNSFDTLTFQENRLANYDSNKFFYDSIGVTKESIIAERDSVVEILKRELCFDVDRDDSIVDALRDMTIHIDNIVDEIEYGLLSKSLSDSQIRAKLHNISTNLNEFLGRCEHV